MPPLRLGSTRAELGEVGVQISDELIEPAVGTGRRLDLGE